MLKVHLWFKEGAYTLDEIEHGEIEKVIYQPLGGVIILKSNHGFDISYEIKHVTRMEVKE